MAAERHRHPGSLALPAAEHADPADLGHDGDLGHHAILTGDRKGAIQGLMLTVLLGLSFTCVQAYEYSHAPFTFGFNHLALVPFTDPGAHQNLAAGAGNFDAIYGSTFFMATGFHGCT